MIIVKVGGGENINWDYIAKDLTELVKKERVIVIHGASSKRDEITRKLGYATQVVTSPTGIDSVYTDKKALEIFLMVYAGLINKQIVAKLQQYGLKAIGLSGVDGGLWRAKAKKEIYVKEGNKVKLLRDNLTGRVENINLDLIQVLLKNDYLPIVCPPALSYEGEIVNTDNDWATAVMAGILKADKIVVLFEAPGLLKNPADEKTLIPRVEKEKLDECLSYANGRMKKKVLGAKKAVELGVKTIFWGDGRIKKPIVGALAGQGTVIK